ncbi:MAG: hypothetical protein K2G36_09925 [Ruminococcus sp.]|nr:hypothetical protein [Ruminococcus sp.]
MIRVNSFTWGYQDIHDEWHYFQADSAGGISVKYSVKNWGPKPVKKYTIYFKAYNGADEIVECTARHRSIAGVSSADCVEKDKTQSRLFENAWYNHSIRRVEIDHIDVVYTDNTTESCIGNYVLNEEEQKKQDKINKKVKKGCLIWFIITVIIWLVILSFFIPSLIKGMSYM